jgi:hypothetical protein
MLAAVGVPELVIGATTATAVGVTEAVVTDATLP